MKLLWLDINSSYSHSSVALPAIHAQLQEEIGEWCTVRGTVNDDPGALAAQVADAAPDIVAATCWLFTREILVSVLARCKVLLPDVTIVLGGPEFLGDNEVFLRKNMFVNGVFRGEGERAFPAWLKVWNDSLSWTGLDGFCFISAGGEYIDGGIARVEDFGSLHFPEESRFFRWDKPFVQFETSRGCFNTCAFCVSGGEKPVRTQPLTVVRKRLENICSRGIRDVRMLDRTFNSDAGRACAMLDMFAEFYPSMHFHLEIHPAMLPENLRRKLSEMPRGLLHIEAGIQSLDENVLKASGRKGSLAAALDGLEFLAASDNLEVHADLIAGLPLYTLDKIFSDVRTLAAMGVDEIQLESLKVLPGTEMRHIAADSGMLYSPLPPYEVLATPWISASEMIKAKHLSRILDWYCNSPRLRPVSRRLVTEEPLFLVSFLEYLERIAVLDSPLSLERRAAVLYEFCGCAFPERLDEVSVAWIDAGLSLKKPPAARAMRIKRPSEFFSGAGYRLDALYGEYKENLRLFFFPCRTVHMNGAGYVFGFDSECHEPCPVFKAEVLS